MITIDRPDLTVDQLVDDFWLAMGGERRGRRPDGVVRAATPEDVRIVPSADVLALLEPCGWCDGQGRINVEIPVRPTEYDDRRAISFSDRPCPSCVDGRPKFQIVVPCPECEANYRAMVTREMHRCDGTVSRTFTVTGDKPLLPVVGRHPYGPFTHADGYALRLDHDMVQIWQCDGVPDGSHYALVGHTEATTHALHVARSETGSPSGQV